MSDFIRHEPCPRCRERGNDRSGDNLGVYTDHSVCFSCGYWKPAKLEFQSLEFQQKEQKRDDIYSLPSDFCNSIRPDALAWIKKYGITQKELEVNNVGWSPEKQMLIFPILGADGDLLMWQGRYFGQNPDYPKYLTKGYKQDVYHYLGRGEPLVLVEDLVSAIKVARVTSSMPLWGSNINRKQGLTIARNYATVAIWLDNDKKREAIKFSQRIGVLFDSVKVIITEKDPKEYSNEEIAAYIRV